MAKSISTQYFNENEYFTKTARNADIYDEEMFNTLADEDKLVYSKLLTNTLYNTSKTFNKTDYDTLYEGSDKIGYLLHTYYDTPDSETYAENKKYFEEKIKSDSYKRAYDDMSNFEKILSNVVTIPVLAATSAITSLGTGLENLSKLVMSPILSEEQRNEMFSMPSLSDNIFKVLTGQTTSQWLSEAYGRYTAVGREGFAGSFATSINDVFTTLVQMTPMILDPTKTIGQMIYYGSMAGNVAAEAVRDNPNISTFNLLLYTSAVTGVEYGTEAFFGDFIFGKGLFNPSLLADKMKTYTGRLFTKLGLTFMSEASEEMAAEVLDWGLYNAFVGQQDITFSQVMYAGLIGGLVGLIGDTVGILSTDKRGNLSKLDTYIKTLNLESNSDLLKSSLEKTSAVSKLQAKYSSESIDTIKTKYSEEYNIAVETDTKLSQNIAKYYTAMAEIGTQLGAEDIAKANDIVTKTFEEKAKMARFNDIYENTTFTGMANAAVNTYNKFSIDGSVVVPVTELTPEQHTFMTSMNKIFPNTNTVLVNVGGNESSKVSWEGSVVYGDTIFINSDILKTKSLDYIIRQVVGHEVIHSLQRNNKILSSKNMDELDKFFKKQGVNIDYDAIKIGDIGSQDPNKLLTRAEKQAVFYAEQLLYNDKFIKDTFSGNKNIFKSIYYWLQNSLKNQSTTSNKGKVIYSLLVNTMTKYRNAVSSSVHNDTDANAIADTLGYTKEQRDKLLITYKLNRVDDHFLIHKFDINSESNDKITCLTELGNLRKNKEVNVDPRLIGNPEYYTKEALDSILWNNKNISFTDSLNNYLQPYNLMWYDADKILIRRMNFADYVNKNALNSFNDFFDTLKGLRRQLVYYKNKNDTTLSSFVEISIKNKIRKFINSLNSEYTTASNLYDSSKLSNTVTDNILIKYSFKGTKYEKYINDASGFTIYDDSMDSKGSMIMINIESFINQYIDYVENDSKIDDIKETDADNFINEIFSTINHEMTHAVSHIQDLFSGANSDWFLNILSKTSDANLIKVGNLLYGDNDYDINTLRKKIANLLYLNTAGELNAEIHDKNSFGYFQNNNGLIIDYDNNTITYTGTFKDLSKYLPQKYEIKYTEEAAKQYTQKELEAMADAILEKAKTDEERKAEAREKRIEYSEVRDTSTGEEIYNILEGSTIETEIDAELSREAMSISQLAQKSEEDIKKLFRERYKSQPKKKPQDVLDDIYDNIEEHSEFIKQNDLDKLVTVLNSFFKSKNRYDKLESTFQIRTIQNLDTASMEDIYNGLKTIYENSKADDKLKDVSNYYKQIYKGKNKEVQKKLSDAKSKLFKELGVREKSSILRSIRKNINKLEKANIDTTEYSNRLIEDISYEDAESLLKDLDTTIKEASDKIKETVKKPEIIQKETASDAVSESEIKTTDELPVEKTEKSDTVKALMDRSYRDKLNKTDISKTKGYLTEGDKIYEVNSYKDFIENKQSTFDAIQTAEQANSLLDAIDNGDINGIVADWTLETLAQIEFDENRFNNKDFNLRLDEMRQTYSVEAAAIQATRSFWLREKHPVELITDELSQTMGDDIKIPTNIIEEAIPGFDNKESFIKTLDDKIKDLKTRLDKESDPYNQMVLRDELRNNRQLRKALIDENYSAAIDTIIQQMDTQDDNQLKNAEKKSLIYKNLVDYLVSISNQIDDGKKLKIDDKGKSILPPDISEKIQKTLRSLKSYRYLALLSSPVTAGRNALSNTAVYLQSFLDDGLSEFLEKKSFLSKETQVNYYGDYNKQYSDYVTDNYLPKIKELTKSNKYNTKTKDTLKQEYAEKTDPINKNKVLKKIKDVEGKLLSDAPWTQRKMLSYLKNMFSGATSVMANDVYSMLKTMYKGTSISEVITNIKSSNKSLADLAQKGLVDGDKLSVLQLAENLKLPIVDEVFKKAEYRGNKAFFKNDNKLTDLIDGLRKKAPKTAEFIDLILPFPRVIYNTTMWSLDHSPVGLAKGLIKILQTKNMYINDMRTEIMNYYKQDYKKSHNNTFDEKGFNETLSEEFKKNFKSNKFILDAYNKLYADGLVSNSQIGVNNMFARADAIETLSQGISGTGVLLAGILLGLLGGFEYDDKDKYLGPVLKIGNLKIKLDDLSPWSTVFSIGATLSTKSFSDALEQMFEIALDNSMLSVVQSSMKYSDSVWNYIRNESINILQQFIPSVFKNITKIFDQGVKNKSGNYFEKLFKTTLSNTPFFSYLVQNKVNPYTGDDLLRYDTGVWGALWNNISPLGAYIDVESDIEKEAKEVDAETTGTGSTYEINGIKYNIANNKQVAKDRAEYINKEIKKLMNTVKYKNFTNTEKKTAIKSIYSSASTIAKINYWTSLGNYYVFVSDESYSKYKQYLTNTGNIKKRYNGYTGSKFINK